MKKYKNKINNEQKYKNIQMEEENCRNKRINYYRYKYKK